MYKTSTGKQIIYSSRRAVSAPGSLDNLDEGREEGGPLRQFGNNNRFVWCVGSFAHGAQSIQRGYAQGGGQVSIGSTPYRRFLQLPSHLFGQFHGVAIQGHN